MNEQSEVLISIITPTYNRATFLKLAIESVLRQSFEGFEMIIVDDGSTDNTREIVKQFDDERLIYYFQKNQGQSVARNVAIGMAKGSYISFLDSDNLWFPNKLELSLKAFSDNPSADIVYGDGVIIDESGGELSRKNMARYSGRITAQLLRDNFVSMNTTMVKRHCFEEMGGLNNKRKVADDYDLWLRFSSRYYFQYIPQFMAYYRVMKDQISSDKARRFASNECILHDFINEFPNSVSSKDRKDGFAEFYRRKARYFSSKGRRMEAFSAFFSAIKYRFFSINNLRTLYRIFIP